MDSLRQLRIGTQRIDDHSPCYVIAEIGHNHQGNLEICKEMFRAAKGAGVDAVKLQKRDNATLFTREAFEKPYDNPNSYGRTYGAHREFLEFGWREYVELKAYAKELGLHFFSTAFDIPSADFLERLDVPAFKIASADLKSISLLEHVARIGKPMIVSTGGATMDDVRRAYDAIMPINPQLCIMQCTAGYPPAWEELNLRVIATYRQAFPDIVIGFSSHDSGIAMAVAGYMLGARVVEKHFTLNRASKGTDHAFSLEPVGMTKMVRDLKRLMLALGDGAKTVLPSEQAPITKMAKSLVAARDLPAGHVLAPEDVCMKSPGGGMPPYEIDHLLGGVLVREVRQDHAFSPADLTAARMKGKAA